MAKMSPFDLVNSINDKKYLMVGPEAERAYNPFLINRALSHFIDALPYIYFLNLHHNLPVNMQYDYLYYGLRKMKRYSKWAKSDKHEYLDDVMRFYKVNKLRAMGYIDRLTVEQLQSLRSVMTNYGGKMPLVNTP